MDGGETQPGDGFLPAVPPGWRFLLIAGAVALVAVDGLFWHGTLFGSRLWHILLWGVSAAGLCIGGYAFVRRDRS